MRQKVNLAAILLLHFLMIQNLSGQKQTDFPDYISRRFLNYCEKVPREEVFIHTDREEYISGEELWLNVYIIDRQALIPSGRSGIVYFEVLNKGNHPVVQKRFFIDGGTGPGQVRLPDTISTGTYTIRAYTNWMKNFMPENCFSKEIRVYNQGSGNVYTNCKRSDALIRNELAAKEEISLNQKMNLSTDNSGKDSLYVIVSSGNNYPSDSGISFYMFIQTHGIINYAGSERLTGEITRISIPKMRLTSGINQITLFDSIGHPVCERYIYTPARKDDKQLTLSSDGSYGRRDKITLDIALEGITAPGLDNTNLSISVVPKSSSLSALNLSEYLVFGSEFGLATGNIFNGLDIDRIPPESMDSLLQGIKSNWIVWSKILSDTLPDFKYCFEAENHQLVGTLLTNDLQLEHPGSFVLMSIPGKVATFQYSTTNYEAIFDLRIPIVNEPEDIIIQPGDILKNDKMIIESSFSDKYPSQGAKNDTIVSSVPAYISKWSANHQINKIYGISSAGDFIKPQILPLRPRRFYGKPDVEIIMDDYINLPDMEEIFFELIPLVSLKKKKSEYEISIIDPLTKETFEAPPVIMIDGVIINNATIIAGIDPEIVEKIDVVREIYIIGDCYFYGIINIITKAGDFKCIPLPDYALKLHDRVFDPVRRFVTPDYSTSEIQKNRIPDLRNTLYWNPSVRPDRNGKAQVVFWASDIFSDYEINIQGFSSAGRSFSLRKEIKVNKVISGEVSSQAGK